MATSATGCRQFGKGREAGTESVLSCSNAANMNTTMSVVSDETYCIHEVQLMAKFTAGAQAILGSNLHGSEQGIPQKSLS